VKSWIFGGREAFSLELNCSGTLGHVRKGDLSVLLKAGMMPFAPAAKEALHG